MAVIFSLSTEVGSTRHTSRVLGAVLRWFNPDMSDAAIQRVQTVVRKGAHLSEYAILALLLWRAVRQLARGAPGLWSRRDAALAFAIALLFAVSDEWHQSRVAERQARASDVLVDGLGAALGLGAVWTFVRGWRR